MCQCHPKNCVQDRTCSLYIQKLNYGQKCKICLSFILDKKLDSFLKMWFLQNFSNLPKFWLTAYFAIYVSLAIQNYASVSSEKSRTRSNMFAPYSKNKLRSKMQNLSLYWIKNSIHLKNCDFWRIFQSSPNFDERLISQCMFR